MASAGRFWRACPAYWSVSAPLRVHLCAPRRIANGLRAGTGVADYAPLEKCEPIWMAVPEHRWITSAWSWRARFRCKGKPWSCATSCETAFGPARYEPRGRAWWRLIASRNRNERFFVAEGFPESVAELRRLLTLERRKLIELRPAAKPLYLSGTHLSAHLLLPWIAGAVESCARRDSRGRKPRASSKYSARRPCGRTRKRGPKAWKRASAERLHRAIDNEILNPFA